MPAVAKFRVYVLLKHLWGSVQFLLINDSLPLYLSFACRSLLPSLCISRISPMSSWVFALESASFPPPAIRWAGLQVPLIDLRPPWRTLPPVHFAPLHLGPTIRVGWMRAGWDCIALTLLFRVFESKVAPSPFILRIHCRRFFFVAQTVLALPGLPLPPIWSS